MIRIATEIQSSSVILVNQYTSCPPHGTMLGR